VGLTFNFTTVVSLLVHVALSWIMVSLQLVMVSVTMEPNIGWLRIHGEPIGVKRDTLGCKGELMLLKDYVALQCKHLILLLKLDLIYTYVT
jgi:hypothetical protein